MPLTLEEAQHIFLEGDTHWDHRNIIAYCRRPFITVEQMNEAMLNNWNSTVHSGDTAYHLGDVSFGKDAHYASYWTRQLNGQVILIMGNHDKVSEKRGLSGTVGVCYCGRLKVKDIDFMLIHDDETPQASNCHGWIICGHHHDSKPFIDPRHKRVNVSVEVIGYTPISLYAIYQSVKAGIYRSRYNM